VLQQQQGGGSRGHTAARVSGRVSTIDITNISNFHHTSYGHKKSFADGRSSVPRAGRPAPARPRAGPTAISSQKRLTLTRSGPAYKRDCRQHASVCRSPSGRPTAFGRLASVRLAGSSVPDPSGTSVTDHPDHLVRSCLCVCADVNTIRCVSGRGFISSGPGRAPPCQRRPGGVVSASIYMASECTICVGGR
jgi:hypothetical protein